jgi:hypothetical protein
MSPIFLSFSSIQFARTRLGRESLWLNSCVIKLAPKFLRGCNFFLPNTQALRLAQRMLFQEQGEPV